MDKMLETIANMNAEAQERVFEELETKFGEEATNVLRERVFYIKLFTNETFYRAVVEEMGKSFYAEHH